MPGYTTLWHNRFVAARFVVALFALPILLLVHIGADLFGANFTKIIFSFALLFQFFNL